MIKIWKPIDGYYYPYRINENAQVEKFWNNGKWKAVPPIYRHDIDGDYSYTFLVVKLRISKDKYRHVRLARLMELAFLPKKKPDEVLSFKNQMVTDCSLNNLFYRSKRELCKEVGARNKKAIEKIDHNGNVVDLFMGLAEASKKEHICQDAIQKRCTNKIKNPYSLNGYTYRYET